MRPNGMQGLHDELAAMAGQSNDYLAGYEQGKEDAQGWLLTVQDRAAIGRALAFESLCKNIDGLPEDAAHESEREDLYAACRVALSALTEDVLDRLARLAGAS